MGITIGLENQYYFTNELAAILDARLHIGQKISASSNDRIRNRDFIFMLGLSYDLN